MNRLKYLDKTLSRIQKETYSQICTAKHFTATGSKVMTCRVLMQFGLIKPDPSSSDERDYVLNGKPLPLTFNEKLPLRKEIIQEIKEPRMEFRHTPMPVPASWSRPLADHTNLSREAHIEKWLNMPVEPGSREMVRVKCLNDHQMYYIMDNHGQQTAQQLADQLQVEKFRIKIFCQANDIEPVEPVKKRKPKDDFHTIPPARLRRMKKADYNTQKKTA